MREKHNTSITCNILAKNPDKILKKKNNQRQFTIKKGSDFLHLKAQKAEMNVQYKCPIYTYTRIHNTIEKIV